MGRLVKTCLQSFLKIVNSTIGIVGIAMILYGLWMVRVWQREMEDSSFSSTAPWFIYSFIGAGIMLCAITCVGHLAASVANSCCLSCYMTIILSLLLLETAIGADVLLNSDWEKDLPNDPTGRFKDFKDFVESNFDIFKWVGLVIVLAQGVSILAAMVLRSVGPTKDYDSDDEYISSARLPLIKPGVEPKPFFGAQHGSITSKNTNFCNVKACNNQIST